MNKEEKREKEVIENICAYAKRLIEKGEYTDDPHQVIDFAKEKLHAYVTPSDLDRLVRHHMMIPSKTQRGSEAEPVPYKDFQDYIDRTRLNVRIEQHGESSGGKIQLSEGFKVKFKPQF